MREGPIGRSKRAVLAVRKESSKVKEFSCGDVVPGCAAKFKGHSDEEILNAVADHARDDHGLTEVPAELAHAVRLHIRNGTAG